MSIWGKTVPGKYKGSQAEENLARSKTSQETSVAGVEWEQGRVVGDGQRGGRWADHAVTQTGFFPPTPSCNWRRRKKNKPISLCRNLCRESNGQSRTSHAVPKVKHLRSGGPATKIRKGNSVIIWSTECTSFPPAAGFLHS